MGVAWSAAAVPAPASAAASPGNHLRLKPIHGQRISQHQPVFREIAGGLQQAPAAPRAAAPSLAAPLGTVPWTALGPQPITGLVTYGASAGRVTALAAQVGGSRVYAGTADGGVWQSTDSGTTWTPLTDTQPTLAVGAIAVRFGGTAATDTIYAGTGEGNHCQDCLPSQGVISSNDGGKTWSAPVSPASGTYAFTALVIDRTSGASPNPQHLMAATNVGLFESTNSGMTWTLRQSGRFDAVVQDPATATKFWASHTTSCLTPSSGQVGIWDTTGTGSWTLKWTGTNPALPAPASRIGLDVGGGGLVAYAAVATCAQGTTIVDGQLDGLLKTSDGGSTWSQLSPPDYFSFNSNPPEAQGWFDNVVAIDPNDATGNTAVFGGVTMVATTTGLSLIHI